MNFSQFQAEVHCIFLRILLHLSSRVFDCLVQYQTLSNFEGDRWTQQAAGQTKSEVMGLGNIEVVKLIYVKTQIFADSDGH